MLDVLISGFRSAKNKLSNKTKLSEENIKDAILDIRNSLLEADVEFNVVNNFLSRVKEKSIGEIVKLKVKFEDKKIKVSPSDHFIKICEDELINLMGPSDSSLHFNDRGPSIIMMVGLHGCGKTTTCAKLANFLKEKNKNPMLVACDIYRPAAIEQLKTLGMSINIPVFYEEKSKPKEICKRSIDYAISNNKDIVIFDTAGRLTIDDVLMKELHDIKKETSPENIFMVCDSMIGQDAVKTAKEFNKLLDLDGFIITKLDGDSRGGAALSIKEVTGKPIKFLTTGESLDKIEEFRPEGIASRILGFGDVVSLVRDFEKVVDEKQAEQEMEKMLKGEFTFTDFLSQIKMIKKMGPLTDIFEKMPFFGDLNQVVPKEALDDRELVKFESMVNSMTEEERSFPNIINRSRVERIARGSGRPVSQVDELMQKFFMMRKMMNKILNGNVPFLKKLNKMGIDFGDMPKFEKEPLMTRPKGLSEDEKRRLKNIKKRKKKLRG